MKSLSKKILSLLLSVVMVITAIPAFTVFADEPQISTTWTEIASTDFTKTNTWTGTQTGLWSSFYNQAGDTFKDLDNSTNNVVNWAGVEYNTDSTTTFIKDDTYGAKVRDGFMYMTGWNKNGSSQSNTPITGKSTFKIDVQFSFYGDYSLSTGDWKDNTFIKLKNDDYSSQSEPWENVYYSQTGYGSIYTAGNSEDSPSIKRDSSTASLKSNYFKISSDNALIGKNNICHYILEYSHSVIRAYITDGSGNILVNFGSVNYTANTSSIKGVQIGATSGSYNSYYQYVAWKSVTFYEGTEATYSPELENTNDKYLFAYFTGNIDDGEYLRYAVSDDGHNWESLNGNHPIVSFNASEVNTINNNTFPAGTATTHAATGHVRDPYLLHAQDGSYYVLATDLDVDADDNRVADWNEGKATDNSKFLIWHVNNLANVDSSAPWCVDITGLMSDYYGESVSVDKAWAPEAIWDREEGKYILFFAASTGGTVRMFYTYTSNFQVFTTPEILLPHVNAANIDGNITYHNGLYYLWYKDETSSKIGYATAEHANGPYGTINYIDGTLEGCEVYYNIQDSKFNLIADRFDLNATAQAYEATDPTGFSGNLISDYHINHIYPRHGSILRISTAQYEALVAKYGKQTYDASVYDDGDEINENLIARYFTDADVTYNAATGEENDLVNHGVTYTEIDGKAAAYFNGNENASAAYGKDDGKYLYAELSDIGTGNPFSDITIEQGFTIDWYSKQSTETTADGHRIFDMSDCTPGTLVWTSEGGDNISSQLHANGYQDFGASDKGKTKGIDFYRGGTKNASTDWHRYTILVSRGQIFYFIDGVLGNTTPARTDVFSADWLEALQEDGHIMFGISSYANDAAFTGYIHDFKIYKGTYTPAEIELSLDALSVQTPVYNAANFYDPMEHKTVDSVEYKNYTNSTDALDDAHGTVLSLSGANQTATLQNGSNHAYQGSASNTGYTVAFWYNAGDNTAAPGNNCILNIGTDNQTIYFTLTESGTLFYNWSESFADIYNAFGSDSAFSGTEAIRTKYKNQWHHYIIRIVPNGTRDTMYFYIDGTLVNTVNTGEGFSLQDGRSVHEYFASSRDVSYGKKPTYWAGATRGHLDDFRIYIGNHNSIMDIYLRDFYGAEALDYVIAAYEEKMDTNGEHIYNNMLPAYRAYVKANRVKDAVEYGNDRAGATLAAATAITDLATAIENMTEWSPKTGTAKAYYFGTEAKTNDGSYYYGNVLYSPNNNTVWGGGGTGGDSAKTFGNYNFKIMYTGNTVLLFNGSGDTCMPLCMESKRKDNKSRYFHYFESETPGFRFKDYWYGYTGSYNTWDTSTDATTHNGSFGKFGYDSSHIYRTSSENFSSSRYFKNKLFINEETYSPNTSVYWSKITSIKVHGYINGDGSTNYDNDVINNDAGAFYVLDYYPLVEEIANELGSYDVSNYKQGGFESVINTLNTAMDFDPNDYKYDGSVQYSGYAKSIEGELGYVGSLISAQISAVAASSATNDSANYATLRTRINTFKAQYELGFEELNETYTRTSVNNFLTAYENATAHMGALLTNDYNGSTAGTLESQLRNKQGLLTELADITNLELAYSKANKLLLSLNGKAPLYDATSLQNLLNAVNATGEDSGKTAKQMFESDSYARKDYAQIEEGADSDEMATAINSALAALTVAAPEDVSDMSTYEAAVEKINNLDKDIYEASESISSAVSTINKTVASSTTKSYTGTGGSATINVFKEGVDDEDVGDAVNRILYALNASVRSYPVLTDSGVESTSFIKGTATGSSSPYSATYGSTMTCTADSEDTAWYLEIKTVSVHKEPAFWGYGQTMTTRVLGTTTVTTVQRDAENDTRVKIIRQYDDVATSELSPIQLVEFVPNNSSYTLPEAPAFANKTFDKYYISGTPYNAGASVTISGDTDIVARYTSSTADCAINATDINSVAHNSTVHYNDKVELDGGENAYAWVEEVSTGVYRPFYIGRNISFYATESVTIFAVNRTAFNSYNFTIPCVNLRKGGVVTSGSKITFNAQLVDGGANIREYGILIGAPSNKGTNGTPAYTPSRDQVIIENSGQQEGYAVLRAKSTKLVGAKQFSISVASLPDGYVYRGYVIYDDGESLQTVYTDLM